MTSSAQFVASDYQAAFLNLLPRGAAWPKDPESTQGLLAAGIGEVFEASDGDAVGLIVDAFPATTEQLLPEWEASLGLPDPCIGPSPTIEARRSQVLTRFTAAGGQSANYFIGVAASLGYPVTITQYAPARFGMTFGIPLNGLAWAFAWQVNAPTFTINYFELGTSALGEPFASWGNNVLQCELTRLSPAHTILLFSYT